MKKQARKTRVWWVTIGDEEHNRDVIYDSFGSRKDAREFCANFRPVGLKVIKVVEVLPRRNRR
jgi:hypothetical protein